MSRPAKPRNPGNNKNGQKNLASAAHAIRTAIAEADKAYRAAAEDSDDEIRCADWNSRVLYSGMEAAHRVWSPPQRSQQIGGTFMITKQRRSPVGAYPKARKRFEESAHAHFKAAVRSA